MAGVFKGPNPRNLGSGACSANDSKQSGPCKRCPLTADAPRRPTAHSIIACCRQRGPSRDATDGVVGVFELALSTVSIRILLVAHAANPPQSNPYHVEEVRRYPYLLQRGADWQQADACGQPPANRSRQPGSGVETSTASAREGCGAREGQGTYGYRVVIRRRRRRPAANVRARYGVSWLRAAFLRSLATIGKFIAGKKVVSSEER